MEILTTILKKKKMKYEKDVQCFYCEKDIKLKDAYLDEDEKN